MFVFGIFVLEVLDCVLILDLDFIGLGLVLGLVIYWRIYLIVLVVLLLTRVVFVIESGWFDW